MRTMLLLSLAASSAAFAQGIIRTPTRDSTRIIFGSSPSGPVSLQLRNFSVELTYPKYGRELGGVSVAFNPASGRYAWIYAPEEDSPSYDTPGAFFFDYESKKLVSYVLPDRIVTLLLRPGAIRVKEFIDKADSLEEAAKKSIELVGRRLSESGGDHWPGLEDGKLVQLPDLGFDFYGPPIRPIDLPTTMVGVSYADGRWRIVLENQWRQEVILDDKYSFVSTKRLADVITPHSFPPPHN